LHQRTAEFNTCIARHAHLAFDIAKEFLAMLIACSLGRAARDACIARSNIVD
jgi:hypothetical protein